VYGVEFSDHYWRVRHLLSLPPSLLFMLPVWASTKQRSQQVRWLVWSPGGEWPSTRSVSDLPSIIWVLPGHRAPGRRRVQAVPGFHPLPRRNPGGSPSCILPALVRWLVWSPGGEWNRQGCRRAGRAAGGRHGARAKRRRDVGGRLFRITQYRALRACLRES